MTELGTPLRAISLGDALLDHAAQNSDPGLKRAVELYSTNRPRGARKIAHDPALWRAMADTDARARKFDEEHGLESDDDGAAQAYARAASYLNAWYAAVPWWKRPFL